MLQELNAYFLIICLLTDHIYTIRYRTSMRKKNLWSLGPVQNDDTIKISWPLQLYVKGTLISQLFFSLEYLL